LGLGLGRVDRAITWQKVTAFGSWGAADRTTENPRIEYAMSAAGVSDTMTETVTNPLDSTQLRDKAIAKRRSREAEEPMLTPNPHRYVLFPIQHDDLWRKYKEHVSVFWRPEEIDLSKDMTHWATLTANEQHFIKRVLGFFAGSDGIVMENLGQRFAAEVQVPEARQFYAVQMMMESVHSETYSLLIDQYVEDRTEKVEILRSIQTVPCIQKKAEWAVSWIQSEEADFATRLLAFAAIEGIFFSGAFCAIFWLKQRGLMPGLTVSNEFIARDEGLHTDFACLLYSKCRHRLPKTKAHKLIREAVRIEKEFITEALPCSLIGMSAPRMADYIEFVADRLLVSLGYERLWNTANPFPWMERISLEGKDNFFEKRVTNYALAGVGADATKMSFALDEEF
jgi:ribonucleotide reductase beta subunit family protein with ferritin-like domain